MSDIKIINTPDIEKEPFIVVYKDSGLPSAPLKEGDDSALTRVLSLYPEVRNVKGKKEVEKGLVHRIDTLTDGLILVALTQSAYDFFDNEQKNNGFIKWYRAECDYVRNISDFCQGFPFTDFEIKEKLSESYNTNKEYSFEAKSFFRPFGPKGRCVRPVTSDSSFAVQKNVYNREYKTQITFDGKKAECSITNGYRHQVRCHLAWCGIPVKGDELYNPLYKDGEDLRFTACKISFSHPLTGERLFFSI